MTYLKEPAMAAEFSIRKSKNDKFHYVLIAGNGEPVATSQMYTPKPEP